MIFIVFLILTIVMFLNSNLFDSEKGKPIYTILFVISLFLMSFLIIFYSLTEIDYTDKKYSEYLNSKVTLFNGININFKYENINEGISFKSLNTNDGNVEILYNQEFKGTVKKSYIKMETSIKNILFFTFDLIENKEYNIKYTIFLKGE